MAKLQGQPQGAFVIRVSDKHFAALSMVKPGGTQYHQQIEQLDQGTLHTPSQLHQHPVVVRGPTALVVRALALQKAITHLDLLLTLLHMLDACIHTQHMQ